MFKVHQFKKGILTGIVTLALLSIPWTSFAGNSQSPHSMLLASNNSDSMGYPPEGGGNPPPPPPGGKGGQPPDMTKHAQKALYAMVTSKQITQAQMDKTLPYFAKMTTQRQPGKFVDPIASAVTDKVLTQEQGAALKKLMMPPRPKNGKGPGGGPGEESGNGPGGPPPDAPGGSDNSSNSQSNAGTATYSQNGDAVSKFSQKLAATGEDQSVVKVANSGTLNLTNCVLSKTGECSSEENSNFYGINAAVLVNTAAKINLTGCTINTNGEGANAVFATGAGSLITLSNVTIKTTENSSRGLDATLKGTIKAKNVVIITQGAHCAALATDRGRGTVIVDGGIMLTSGEGSPGIYSTGSITVSNAQIKATGSEAAVIEGKNSITLANTSLIGTVKCGAMLYQSFSGDAEVGTSSFVMTGGSLTAEEGPLFYSTNTKGVIEVKGAELDAASGILLRAGSDRWGNQGSNGAEIQFTADSEQLEGDVICDTISTIAIKLQKNTILKGAINTDNDAKSLTLTLDRSSQWNVTGNSYLTSLTDADNTLSNILDNGHIIYYNSKNSANSWLFGKTYTLSHGGTLAPR